MEEARSELEREEDEEATELLRDRFRLSTISIVEAQGSILSSVWIPRK